MASALQSAIQTLADIGFFKFALPFLLMFAIVYGLLQKLSIFGDNDQVDAIVAVVSGFFVAYFVMQSSLGLSAFLVNFFGAFAIVAVGLMVVVMGAGLGGYDGGWAWGDRAKKAFFVLGALASLSIFISWGGLNFLKLGRVGSELANASILNNSTFITLLVVLLGAGLIYWVTGEGEAGGGGEAGGEGGG